jgi:hypothetical protein
MTLSVIKNKLINEINLLSEEKLAEVYNFIHFFRLGIERKEKETSNDILSFSGVWKEMGDETFDNYLLDISSRRGNAFSSRRSNETRTN